MHQFESVCNLSGLTPGEVAVTLMVSICVTATLGGSPVAMRLLASDCLDGDCPSIWTDEDTGDVIVRGPVADDPTREIDVRYPRAQWDRFMGQLGQQ